MHPIILASASPRRAEILRTAGIPFTVEVTPVDETRLPAESAEAYVRRLAQLKGEACSTPGIVLAADTTVRIDSEILEKPADPADAARMLRLLSGRTHDVLTGICLRRGREVIVDHETTRVRFVPLTEEDVQKYVSSGEPMGKAGAYAIQGLASKYIDRIEGCYFNVVGLPVALVWRHLKSLV